MTEAVNVKEKLLELLADQTELDAAQEEADRLRKELPVMREHNRKLRNGVGEILRTTPKGKLSLQTEDEIVLFTLGGVKGGGTTVKVQRFPRADDLFAESEEVEEALAPEEGELFDDEDKGGGRL